MEATTELGPLQTNAVRLEFYDPEDEQRTASSHSSWDSIATSDGSEADLSDVDSTNSWGCSSRSNTVSWPWSDRGHGDEQAVVQASDEPAVVQASEEPAVVVQQKVRHATCVHIVVTLLV